MKKCLVILFFTFGTLFPLSSQAPMVVIKQYICNPDDTYNLVIEVFGAGDISTFGGYQVDAGVYEVSSCYDSSLDTGMPCYIVLPVPGPPPVCGCNGVEYRASGCAEIDGYPLWTEGPCTGNERVVFTIHNLPSGISTSINVFRLVKLDDEEFVGPSTSIQANHSCSQATCLTCHPKSNPLIFNVTQDTSITIEHLMTEITQGCTLSFDITQNIMEIPFKCSFLKGQPSAIDSFWVYDLVKGDSCLSFVRFVNGGYCPCPFGKFVSVHTRDEMTVCNLFDIENKCFRMKQVDDKSWIRPFPLCNSAGEIDSPNLITFVAGSGNYSININASNCSIENNVLRGIQVALFSDSLFKNSVYCAHNNSNNGFTKVEIPSNVLMPFHKYYLIIDGYSNSFCDISIDISGNYIPYSLSVLDCHPKNNPLEFAINYDTTLNVNSLSLQPNCSNLSFDRNTKLLKKDINCTFLNGQPTALDSFWVYDLVKGDSCLSYVRFVNGGYCCKPFTPCNDNNSCTYGDYYDDNCNCIGKINTSNKEYSFTTTNGETIIMDNIADSCSVYVFIFYFHWCEPCQDLYKSHLPSDYDVHPNLKVIPIMMEASKANIDSLKNYGFDFIDNNPFLNIVEEGETEYLEDHCLNSAPTVFVKCPNKDTLLVKTGIGLNKTMPEVINDVINNNCKCAKANEVTLTLPSKSANYLDTFSIPVAVTGFQNIESFQFPITWDTLKLEFIKIHSLNKRITNFNTSNFGLSKKGQVLCSFGTTTPFSLPNIDTLFQLSFKVISDICDSTEVKLPISVLGNNQSTFNVEIIKQITNQSIVLKTILTDTKVKLNLSRCNFLPDCISNQLLWKSNTKLFGDFYHFTDINNDDTKDMIVSHYNQSKISIYLFENNSYKLLIELATLPNPNGYYNSTYSPVEFILVDMNNDGINDLIVNHTNGASCFNTRQRIFLGSNVSPFFNSNLFLDAPLIGNTCAYGLGTDLNNDGKTELLVFNQLENLRIFSSPSFGLLNNIDIPRDIEFHISDINNDGYKDIVGVDAGFTPSSNGGIFCYLGQQNFNFSQAQIGFNIGEKPTYGSRIFNNKLYFKLEENSILSQNLYIADVEGSSLKIKEADLLFPKNSFLLSVNDFNHDNISDVIFRTTNLDGSFNLLISFGINETTFEKPLNIISNSKRFPSIVSHINKNIIVFGSSVGDTLYVDQIKLEQSKFKNQSFSICKTESVTVGNNTYTLSGTYIDTLQSSTGCDSIITTNITQKPNTSITQNIQICQGKTHTVGSNTYNLPGVYIDTLLSSSGCDSIITTTIIQKPNASFAQNIQICQGESISIGSSTYSSNGSYVDTLMSINGCDSIVSTKLNVLQIQKIEDVIAICAGQSHQVGINLYTQSGNYVDTLSTIFGCDSIISTFLTVRPSQNISFNAPDRICKGFNVNLSVDALGTYLWSDGQTSANISEILNANKTYQVTVTDQYGCKASSSVSINVVEPKNKAIPFADTLALCLKDTIIDPYSFLAQFDADGILSLDEKNISGQPFNLMELTEGIHTINYGFFQQAPCPDMDTSFTLVVKDCSIKDCSFSLVDDSIKVNKNEASEISLIINDILPEEYIISIISVAPDVLESTNLSDEGLYSFTVTGDFGDIVQAVYEICTPDCAECKQASLWIDNEVLKDIIRTNIILPNTSGKNATLRFTIDEVLKDSELYIFNRNGDRIFYMKDYNNSWNADGYPGGIYYYVLRYRGVDIKKTLTVMK